MNIFDIKPNKVTTDLSAFPVVWLSEDTGHGKTWNLNLYLTEISPKGKKPLFIMLEDRYQTIPGIMAYRVRSIPELLTIANQLKTPKAKEIYSCIVFDTADKLDSMLEKYISDSKEVEITGDLGFGKGNKYIKGKLFLIDELRNNGWKVHFTAQTSKNTNIVTGVTTFEPKLNKETWAKLSHDAYMIGMIKPDIKNKPKPDDKNNKWWLTFKSTQEYPRLKDSIGVPDRVLTTDLAKVMLKSIEGIEGAEFTSDDTINIEVTSSTTFEEVIARGTELGGILAENGKLEDALNILRTNIGVVDEKTNTPKMFDSLLPSQRELAEFVVIKLEEVCGAYGLL